MPRLSDNIEINDKKITVYELTVEEIINIGESTKNFNQPELGEFKSLIEDNLGKAVTGITMDDLIKMTPSDIKKIYETFKEVNSTFFEVARSMGLTELLISLKQAVQKDFLKLLVGSYSSDT